MRVVVLGGAGQIGAPLVFHLNELGHVAIAIDILNDSSHDLRNSKEIWQNEIRLADFVFFLAFDVGGSRYLAKYEKSKAFLDNNIMMMFNVFKELEESKVPFIFASSQMSNMNFSPYGVLKRIGEFYSETLGGVVCKFWNVYGFETSSEKNHVISDFLEMAISDRKIKMRTNGIEKRQFLFSQDSCEALVALMDNYQNLDKKEIYDISSYEWTSIAEVAHLIAEYTNAEVFSGDKEDTVQQDIMNQPNKNILAFWKPRFNLPMGIEELLKKLNEIRQR